MAKKHNKYKIYEELAPVKFLDQNDMCQTLTKYCYHLFDTDDKSISQLGECVDDIIWDQNIAGLTIDPDEADMCNLIVNPFFAEKLLDRSAQIHQTDWDYNEDEDEYPEQYFELFRYALLWGAYLALVSFSNRISTSNADAYLNSWKKNIATTDKEMAQSFPEEHEKCFDEFKKILGEFIICRL